MKSKRKRYEIYISPNRVVTVRDVTNGKVVYWAGDSIVSYERASEWIKRQGNPCLQEALKSC